MGDQKKERMGCFLDDLRAFFLVSTLASSVDDCSRSGRGELRKQDGETRGGTFHGEMDRCRQS